MKHNIRIKITLLFALLLLCYPKVFVSAQDAVLSLQGKVSDEFGRPLSGVAIISENGKNTMTTDYDGTYSIMINDGSEYVVFSSLGYKDHTQPITLATQVDIKMEFDGHRMDEVIHMGRSDQKRKEVSGAVSTVTGEELEKAPVANLALALNGHLSGLFTTEIQSELSRTYSGSMSRGFSTGSFNYAGSSNFFPLVVIDGVPTSYNANQVYEYISAREIETVSLLKDASTTALYGIQSANGALVITTKRGKAGPVKINTSFDQSLQQVTTKPRRYSSWEYAMLRNQAGENDGNGEYYYFTQREIDKFREGNDPLYPNNDWYDMFFKDFATMTRVGVNVTGGTDNVRYFSNVNFMHQSGQFKTDNDNYKSGVNNNWFNYRTNVDFRLHKYLDGFVNLSGNIKRERTPHASSGTSIYGSLLNMAPTIYGPLTPDGEVVRSATEESPTYGRLNRRGFDKHTVTNINSQIGLTLDMGFLTKGLSLAGLFSYQTNSVGSLQTHQEYERYQRTSNFDELEFTKQGSQTNTALGIAKSNSHYYHLDANADLRYNRKFGKHHISGLGYFFYQSLATEATSNPNFFPYNRLHLGAQVAYGYDDRYFVKFDLGYSGSEQFARGNRYFTTPSIAGSWIVTNESFLKNSEVLTLLKLRASYGKTANDDIAVSRYSYLDNVTFGRGGPIGSLTYIVNEGTVGNPTLEAEFSKKQNYGIDIGFLNSITLSVDYFYEKMDNMIVDATGNIPSYQGVPLGNYPRTNVGKFENWGTDITLNYRKQINKDWTVFAGGMFTYVKNKLIFKNEVFLDENYAYRTREEGYSLWQSWGLLTDGFWSSQEEIDNSGLTYEFGTPRPGDLKYKDLNNDNVINDADLAPIGDGFFPNIYYSFSGGFTYKSFDLSFMFQGVSQWKEYMGGYGVWETSYDGVFSRLHANAWTKERHDAGAKITYPALSASTSTNHRASDFFIYDRSFIRLKNVQLTYTLPETVARKISADKIRIILSGQNLLTWDNMKTKDFGPEARGFQSVPVYRVYNIGVNVVF